MPLKVSDGIAAWIKDFKKSDAPQFKGKSEKERRDQAIAAYLSAKRGTQKETWQTISKTPDGQYKIQRDSETGARRKIPTSEQMGVKHVFRYVTKSGQGTHHHDSSDKSSAAKAIEKKTGQKVLGINHIGTGIPSRRENLQTNEEFSFKVDIEGLPSLFMTGNSPGSVKSHLRKLVKQPSMVKSVERQTKHDIKKRRRKQAELGEGMNRRDRLRAKLAAVGKDMEKTNKELKKTMGIKDKPTPRTSDGKPYKSKFFKDEMDHSQDWGKPGSTKRAKEITPGEKNEITINKIRKGLYKTAKGLGDVQAVKKKKVGKRIARRTVGKLAGRALGKLFR